MSREELLRSLTEERFGHSQWARQRMCGDKQKLPSRTVADNYAWLVQAANDDGIQRRAYQCPECDEWHITRKEDADAA